MRKGRYPRKVEGIRKLRCTHCNYIWWSKSEMVRVTCPRCHLKFKPKRGRKEKEVTIKDAVVSHIDQ